MLRVTRGIACPVFVISSFLLQAPCSMAHAQVRPGSKEIDSRARMIEAQAIEWRRSIHKNPELGNREFQTAALVAEHLRSLGCVVDTAVGHTGVVALLKGKKPGPVVALRAEMDALPVTEAVDIPFASKVRTQYNGRQTGVMHACGHDLHTAILMGTATVLAGMRDQLGGSVEFIFQPDEEGTADPLEGGGAQLMLNQGLLKNPTPGAILALHVTNQYPVGQIHFTPGPTKAGSDDISIVVHGRQTHAARPWEGTDPVVVASQIVLGLQTIVSRQTDITVSPAVLSIAMIHGGVRPNIIPDSVVLMGGLRWFDVKSRQSIEERVRRTAESIASSAGATAQVTIEVYAPPVSNDVALTQLLAPTLESFGAMPAHPSTTSDDFAYFSQRVPGLYFFLGVTPDGVDPDTTASNHSPRFFPDEGAILMGIRVMSSLAVDYLAKTDHQ